ncbi:MAG: hypothetical protein JSU68_06990 [Phycisphaerales bacterium]|nr:MAG: hypothetical protein JSU68_06990 [Phycisphaerales bacterium]
MRSLRLSTAIVLLSAGTSLAQRNTLSRDHDPVVILGEHLTLLLGLPPGEVVGFRYEGGWEQIPVQIDERKFADFGVVYGSDPIGLGTMAYVDSLTYTGPDTDPEFDADDELVFMAPDAGDRAPTGAVLPGGVFSAPALEVEVVDPLDGGVGYVYLFQTDGTLDPDANQDYVTYDFVLLAGDYIPNYNNEVGPNPEDSAAVTPYYRAHFSDRWIRDEMNIYVGGASGADILDRHKNMFAPGNCGRTEDTFSGGEGAFFTNKDGPARAIRSYMGANSGPFTQREHFFYEQRHDVFTFLRVHAISGMVDIYDYSPDATGMIYHNDLNPTGVTVDGEPDVVTAGPIIWEMVTGAQGTLIVINAIETNIDPFTTTSYYSDDATPSVTQCTGDAYEYASSGTWIDQSIPNTDPYLGATDYLTAHRVEYYEPPGQTVGLAATRSAQALTPLEFTVGPYQPSLAGDGDGDGDVDLNDFATFAMCYGGAAVTTPPGGCSPQEFAASDLDDDGDVDLGDFATFANNFTG